MPLGTRKLELARQQEGTALTPGGRAHRAFYWPFGRENSLWPRKPHVPWTGILRIAIPFRQKTENPYNSSSTKYRLRSGAERLTISPKNPAKKVCTPNPTANRAM